MYFFFNLLYSCNYELISIDQVNNIDNINIFSALIEWIINIPFLIMEIIMAIFQPSKSLDIKNNNDINSDTIYSKTRLYYSIVGISTILIFGSVFYYYNISYESVIEEEEEEEEEKKFNKSYQKYSKFYCFNNTCYNYYYIEYCLNDTCYNYCYIEYCVNNNCYKSSCYTSFISTIIINNETRRSSLLALPS